MIYFVAAVAGIAGFLFGFDEGVIAGALHLLKVQFSITPVEEGMMTAAVPFGALFGALVAGRAVSRYGRRAMLLFAAGLFALGALFAALAIGAWMLTLARLVLGFAIGIAGLVAPLYISESAPAQKRGMLVSIYQLAITLGILGAYLVGFAFDDSWRTMFSIGIIPGLALFAGMMVLRDTPRWLALKGRPEEARVAMAKLRGVPADDPRLAEEFEEIEETAESDAGHGGWAELFAPMARPALIVGIGLFFLQQLSGINAVIYYAPAVFKEAGFGDASTQILATVGVGIVNVLMTLVGMALIDRIGRRKLLLGGFFFAALALGMIAIGAVTGAQALDVVAFVGLLVYIAAFAASIGPLPWVMMSEVFPLNVRGLGMSVASITNWGFNFIVVFSFPVLVSTIGLGGVFAIYSIVCALGIAFTFWYVPETNGVALEDIEEHLRSGKPFRQLGNTAAAMPAGLAGAVRP
ncbi:sugar porter family MFS transporter [Amorphus sp. 3PC139-8]|uniref:sugar porter family MFS transporter n=1 Tax=Amorphus sp. 3PC139-8 TaxID=2735676 RepID=UPI00345CC73D